MTLVTLKKRADFLRVSTVRLSYGQPSFLLTAAPSPTPIPDVIRVGYTATKKLGNAVVRNCAKRRLREAVRAVFPVHARNTFDYVLIARSEAPTQPLETMKENLIFALKKLHQKAADAPAAPAA